ncbi:sugar transferase [bacterium]|nr:sugar transferase [bacterium]MBU1651313.1 sugar transferase [bacterium]MBU1881624.1 sugar transferase [bacterium]
MAKAEMPQIDDKDETVKNGSPTANGAPKSYTLHNVITRFYFAVQVIADIVVITGSMLLGYWFYHKLYTEIGLGKGIQPFEMYLRLTVITNVIMLLTFERLGLYKRTISVMNIDEIKGIFKAVLLTAVILFTASFYFKDISYSRLIVSYSFAFLIVFLNIERYLFFKLFQKLHTKGIGVRRALIYGAGEAGRMLAERFIRSPRLGVLLVGFLDDNVQYWGKKIRSKSDEVKYALPCFGGFEQILEATKSQHIDELFISIPSVPQTRIAEIIRQCEETGIKFFFIPNLFDYKLQSVAIESLDGVPLLTVKESHINWSYLIIKRVMDIVLSLIGMIFLGPAIVLLTSMIKKDSPGQAIFKQERVGLNGKPFMIYKFRSMYVDVPKYGMTPHNSDDPRITKIGRFLRRSSLDELPQLLNVLKGEMSLVGPRPEMQFIVDQYDTIMRERLKVKPGITGMWQISADRAKQIHDNIDYDLYYIENFSPLLDVVIIIRTIFMAIKGKGAW